MKNIYRYTTDCECNYGGWVVAGDYQDAEKQIRHHLSDRAFSIKQDDCDLLVGVLQRVYDDEEFLKMEKKIDCPDNMSFYEFQFERQEILDHMIKMKRQRIIDETNHHFDFWHEAV